MILKKRSPTEEGHQADGAICRSVKKAISKNISKREYDLVNFPSQLAFYKYANSKLGR